MLVVVLRAECAALQVGAFRKRLEKVVGDKHEEVMGRMGAIMALGLVDAGGPSCASLCRFALHLLS